MQRTCSKCGERTNVKGFRIWNGRCSQCESAISIDAAVQDLRRPVPTTEDVTEFLRYMDDLQAIRWFRIASIRFAILAVVAHLMFGFGMASGLLDGSYGRACWLVLVLLFMIIVGRDFRIRCPRCDLPFSNRISGGFRVPVFVSDSCAHCRLRALSQSDIRRYLLAQQKKEPIAAN